MLDDEVWGALGMTMLRPMERDTVASCDWGGCDRVTFCERFSLQANTWLACCLKHALDDVELSGPILAAWAYDDDENR